MNSPSTPRTSRACAPVVDVVFPTSEERLEDLFDPRTRKLIGALHRRFWDRRRTMIHERAVAGGHASTELRNVSLLEPNHSFGEVVVDVRDSALTWEDRLDQFDALRAAVRADHVGDQLPVVRLRGWVETEAGVLVDGRAVPGCVVDVAVALSQAADRMRDGENVFVFELPESGDQREVTLWADLLCLAGDRTGLERGSILVSALTNTRRSIHQADTDVAVA